MPRCGKKITRLPVLLRGVALISPQYLPILANPRAQADFGVFRCESERMGRVLPFIFVMTGLVFVAVFQAHTNRRDANQSPLAEVQSISEQTPSQTSSINDINQPIAFKH